VQPEWLQPPFSVTDVMAVLLWVLAALYATLKVRDHEPGMGWFAMAMALMAVYVGNNERHLPNEPIWVSAVHGWLLVVLSGTGCLVPGFASYVGLHGRARTRASCFC